MRIGILGDVHANLEALRAVVRALQGECVDAWVQVGDLVGYGPQPSECIDLVRELGCSVCLGNHDAAAVGMLDVSYFNQFARDAILWTRDRLRPEDVDYLRGLPLVVKKDAFTVVHGSLDHPEEFGYVISPTEAAASLAHQETFACFVGHSHVPAVHQQLAPGSRAIESTYQCEEDVSLARAVRVLMNVGSVGQPRDEDPRAAYGLMDLEARTACVRRVAYDIEGVQRKIRAAGLPAMLANRLSMGI